ncbi:hypothetical protein LINPERPRIM_LOCUS20151, partial [Linum perenne]
LIHQPSSAVHLHQPPSISNQHSPPEHNRGARFRSFQLVSSHIIMERGSNSSKGGTGKRKRTLLNASKKKR